MDSQPFETFRSSVSGRSETCPELSTVVVLMCAKPPSLQQGGDLVGLRQGILTDTGRGTDDEVRFVYFHSSGEAIPPRTHQGASQLMQPRPGRTGTAQAQDALAPQCTHSVLCSARVS